MTGEGDHGRIHYISESATQRGAKKKKGKVKIELISASSDHQKGPVWPLLGRHLEPGRAVEEGRMHLHFARRRCRSAQEWTHLSHRPSDGETIIIDALYPSGEPYGAGPVESAFACCRAFLFEHVRHPLPLVSRAQAFPFFPPPRALTVHHTLYVSVRLSCLGCYPPPRQGGQSHGILALSMQYDPACFLPSLVRSLLLYCMVGLRRRRSKVHR